MEKLIFEYQEGHASGHVPEFSSFLDPSETISSDATNNQIELPDIIKRKDLPLPNLSEIDVVRHFTNLSRMNFGIDVGPYPLGSCTMKYNPRQMKISLDWRDSRGFIPVRLTIVHKEHLE